jgi:hypothetical protein
MPPIVLPQAESESTMSQAAAIVVTVFVIFTHHQGCSRVPGAASR